MRTLGVVLLVAACAHPSPRAGVSAPALPDPVTLQVSGAGKLEPLVAAAKQRVRDRLEAAHHAVLADAPHSIEIELQSAEGAFHEGRYEYCVKLVGRVVHGDARFAAFDTVKQRCDVVGVTAGGGSDLLSAAVRLTTASIAVLTMEQQPITPQSRLFVEALDELTDALGRQAVSRSRPAGS